MRILILILIGAAGGVIGGMGMGGGTLLIPLLVLFSGLNQHTAQIINLTAFIPMSIISLVIHFKNKLVDVKTALIIALPASAAGVAGALLAANTNSHKLSLYFGIFLLLLGVYQLAAVIVQKIKNRDKIMK